MEHGTGRDFLNEVVKTIPGLLWERDSRELRLINKGPPIEIPDGVPKPLTPARTIIFPEVQRGEPTNGAFRYEMRAKTLEGRVHVSVEKVPVLPAFEERMRKRSAALPEPEKTLLTKFVSVVQSYLNEDVAGLEKSIHPDGIRDGTTRFTKDEVVSNWIRAFKKLHYQQFKLDDVLIPDQIEIKALAEGRYRVSAKPKTTRVGAFTFFDDELWFVFEKSVEGQWLIVEFHQP